MRVPFVKMHGLGNDFIVLDARVQDVPPMTAALAAALADRHAWIVNAADLAWQAQLDLIR